LPDAVRDKASEVKKLIRKTFNKNPRARVGDEWFDTTKDPLALDARVEEAYSSIVREAEMGGDVDFRGSPGEKREWLVARHEEMTKQNADNSLGTASTRGEIQKLGKNSKEGKKAAKQRERLIEQNRKDDPEGVTAFFRKEIIEGKLARIERGDPTPGNAGPLIHRTLDLEDTDLAALGVIETDMDVIGSHYAKRMGTVIEMADEFGDINANTFIHDVITRANLRAIDMPEGKAKQKVEKQIAELQQHMYDLRDIRLGLFQIPDNPMAWSNRLMRSLRGLSILTSMGKSTQMAMADIGNVSVSQGFKRTFGLEFQRMMQGIHGPNNAIRILDREAELAGTVHEVLTAARAQQFTETGSQFFAGSRFERGLANATQKFFFINALAPWTDHMRRLAGGMISSELIRMSVLWADGKLAADEIQVMGRLIGNKQAAIQIANEWRASGSQKWKNMFLANSEQWTSDTARRTFRAGINTEVHRAVPTPGDVDKPTFMLKSEWGKIFGQYRGFALGATNRIMGAGLQSKRADRYMGLATMVTMAAIIDSLVRRPDYIQMPVEEQIFRAVELSGVTGFILDANDSLERASNGTFGIRPALGLDIRERNPSWASQLGAIGAVPNQWLSLVWAMTSPEAEANDKARTLRYMMPYNNVMWWNDAVNRMQRSTVDFIEEGKK